MSTVAVPRPRVASPADLLCVGGLLLSSAYYLLAVAAIAPLVGTHPVLLEALAGSVPSMVAAGAFARVGRVSLALALAAPVLGLSAFDPLWWWAGRRYGTRAVGLVDRGPSPRTAAATRRALAVFARWGGWTLVLAYFLPVPNAVVYAAAGWSGFSFLRFAVLDLAGTLLRVLLVVLLGYAAGEQAVHLATLVSRYVVLSTVLLVLAALAFARLRGRGGSPRRQRQKERPPAGESVGDPSLGLVLDRHLGRLMVGPTAAPGVVYAAATPAGRVVGRLGAEGSQPLGPQVAVELGSLTKLFTALLLAEAVRRQELALDDPVSRLLPARTFRDCPAADLITLRHLATHTSGLPRIPAAVLAAAVLHPSDPYARTTSDGLYAVLRRRSGARPGPYRYSNLGFALLGDLLARAAGTTYAALLQARVTGPLGLTGTTVGPPPGFRVAVGHRGSRTVPPWNLGAYVGAGGVWSTATDLLCFLQATLDPASTPLAAALDLVQQPQQQLPDGGWICLGWHRTEQAGGPVLWHTGGTGGFTSMVAVDRDGGRAVAAVATVGPRRTFEIDRVVLEAMTDLPVSTCTYE